VFLEANPQTNDYNLIYQNNHFKIILVKPNKILKILKIILFSNLLDWFIFLQSFVLELMFLDILIKSIS
jgi:hypothetical protein